MNVGRNRHGDPLLRVWRKPHGSWGIDINEGGCGLIFNLHHWRAGDTSYPGWFVYGAYWFTPRLHGRASKLWLQ